MKLDIVAHARVFLLYFYVVDNPFKSWYNYDMIGTFWAKLHGIIAQELLCHLRPYEQ